MRHVKKKKREEGEKRGEEVSLIGVKGELKQVTYSECGWKQKNASGKDWDTTDRYLRVRRRKREDR